MIECDQRCVRCKNHQHHELWVPGCQVAVCREDLRAILTEAIEAKNSTILRIAAKLLDDGGTGREWPDGERD